MNSEIIRISTEGNETYINITGLQSGMSIQVEVAGVSRIREVSLLGPASDPFTVTVNTRTGKMLLEGYFNVYSFLFCSSFL